MKKPPQGGFFCLKNHRDWLLLCIIIEASICVLFKMTQLNFGGEFMTNLRKTIIFIGLVMVSISGQTDYLSGMAAFAQDDYPRALLEWRPLAEQGQAEAQFNLGALYDQGLGVEQDRVQAASWYQRAAAQGHVQAQHNLAVLYANGIGIAQDYSEAVRWYRQAAARGLQEAQFNLGVLYENGFGTARDHAEAADWYQRAAEQGHTAAQNNLGVLYANGQGVPQNLAVAYAWYEAAAARGNAKARANRDQLILRLSAEQLVESQRLAEEYIQRYRPAPSP